MSTPFFDDTGAVIPVVDFDFDEIDGDQAADDEAAIRQETIIRLLALLLDGARDAVTIGRSAVLLASALRLDGAPAGVEELGHFLHISHQAASKGLQKTRDKLQQIGTI